MIPLLKYFALAALLQWNNAFAGQITYNIDLLIGPGSIGGYMTTDGTLDMLSKENITSWNLIIDDGMDVFTMNTGNSSFFETNALVASPTELILDVTGGILMELFILGVPDFPEPGVEQSSFYATTVGDFTEGILYVGHGLSQNEGHSFEVSINEALVFGTVGTPATLVLFGLGLACLGWTRRKSIGGYGHMQPLPT